MSRATEDLLDELHGLTAESFLAEIRRYRKGEIVDNEGNPLPIPASLLSNAGKFLKDNGIDRPSKPADPLDELAKELPTLGDVIPFEGVRS